MKLGGLYLGLSPNNWPTIASQLRCLATMQDTEIQTMLQISGQGNSAHYVLVQI